MNALEMEARFHQRVEVSLFYDELLHKILNKKHVISLKSITAKSFYHTNLRHQSSCSDEV